MFSARRRCACRVIDLLHLLRKLLGVKIPMKDGAKFTLPDAGQTVAPVMTPREIVSELDRYIVGQKEAKRALAIALRNRWRRQLVPVHLREAIVAVNIIMIRPT